MSFLENIFSSPELSKRLKRQEQSHEEYALHFYKNAADYYPMYIIKRIYSLEERQENNKTFFQLNEVVYDQANRIKECFKNHEGRFGLIDLSVKKEILKNVRFVSEIRRPFTDEYIPELVPDLKYILDDEEYFIHIELNPTVMNEEKEQSIKSLYKYLYGNLGEIIEIDPNFEKSGCYETRCRLVYFRLSATELFIVVDHKGEKKSHLFKDIYHIDRGMSLGEKAMKFTLHTDGVNYRMYLFHPEESNIAFDPGIEQITKLVYNPEF